MFVQVSQLLSNELHHYDPSLKQLSREVADVFLKEGVLKGMPLILTNNGQFRPMSKMSPNWPWKQLLSTLDSINPNYDQDALKKFMGCTHLAMRDALYNQHQADQMSKGRNLTEEMQIANSLEDLPYEEFDVTQASQSRVVEEEVKKPTQSKAGEKEVEEEVEGEKDALQASPSRAEVEKENRPDQSNKKTEAEEETEEEKNALKAATSRAEKRPDQTKEEKKEEEAKDGKEEKKEEEAKDGKEGKKEAEEEGEEESKMKKKEEEAKDGKEEKKEEEVKDGKEGKKEAEEEGEEESKMKKEKRKNTRSTNKGELITPQPAATKAIEKDEDFPAPEFHLSINATTPRKGRAPQHSILPRRERGRAPTKR